MRFFLLLTFLATATFATAQPTNLLGAWESTFVDGEGRRSQLTMTIVNGYMVMTAYNADEGTFLATLGGSWRADQDNFSVNYEFDSADSTAVGGVRSMPYALPSENLLVFNNDKYWTRVDDLNPGRLGGAWEIIGRKRDGKMQDLTGRRTGPRKTMKILSGTRFQWIAFNTDTGQFSGTGGGTYTTDDDGLYIEKIEFFSRDATRAGKQLSFDYKKQNGDWIHKGYSSKGAPIHEVWSPRR